MTSNSIFLDANILLEVILARDKQSKARKLLESQAEKPFISALTAHLVVHFGQNIVELPVLHMFLEDYTILTLEKSDFEWALLSMRGSDFEDALQIAIAVRNGCGAFITFDKKLASNYGTLTTIKTQLL